MFGLIFYARTANTFWGSRSVRRRTFGAVFAGDLNADLRAAASQGRASNHDKPLSVRSGPKSRAEGRGTSEPLTNPRSVVLCAVGLDARHS